jgi:hypothetical protein
MIVRVTSIDSKIPNLALMRIAAWHKDRGDEVHFSKALVPGLFEPDYDRVYGSTIFKFSAKRIARFKEAFPDAIVGGTGTFDKVQVEDVCPGPEKYTYDIYPDFQSSLGFTARGCRLSCKFCVVPEKEGKPKSVNTIAELYRGGDYPRHIQLLDNDFFGQAPEQWRERVREIIDGRFKICFNQGLNVRLITDESAEALAEMPYYDDQFQARRLYSAWDNLKDMKIFFKGVDTLEKYGIPPKHILAYMLIGFAKGETMEDIKLRHKMMKDRGIFPFPMVYDRSRPELRAFARWAIRFSHACSFEDYNTNVKKHAPTRGNLFADDPDEDGVGEDYVLAGESPALGKD